MTAGKRQGVTRQQFLAFAHVSRSRNQARDRVEDRRLAGRARYPAPAVGLPPWYRFATNGLLLRYSQAVAGVYELESGHFQGFLSFLTGNMSDHFITVRCGIFFDGLRPSAQIGCPCALELRAVGATSAGALAPLRRDRRRSDRRGWRSRCHDSSAQRCCGHIGSKSWPFDNWRRPWVFRPYIRLLPLGYIASGDVRAVATNRLESGRFQGFCWF